MAYLIHGESFYTFKDEKGNFKGTTRTPTTWFYPKGDLETGLSLLVEYSRVFKECTSKPDGSYHVSEFTLHNVTTLPQTPKASLFSALGVCEISKAFIAETKKNLK